MKCVKYHQYYEKYYLEVEKGSNQRDTQGNVKNKTSIVHNLNSFSKKYPDWKGAMIKIWLIFSSINFSLYYLKQKDKLLQFKIKILIKLALQK